MGINKYISQGHDCKLNIGYINSNTNQNEPLAQGAFRLDNWAVQEDFKASRHRHRIDNNILNVSSSKIYRIINKGEIKGILPHLCTGEDRKTKI